MKIATHKSFLSLSLLCAFAIANNALFALSFGTYNIRNFNYDDRYKVETNTKKLEKIISSLEVDLLAVQEIKETVIFDKFIKNNFNHFSTVLSKCGGTGNQKLGFIYNSDKLKVLKTKEDFSANIGQKGSCNRGVRPFMIVKFRYKKGKSAIDFYAISVHLKAGANQKSIEKRYAQLNLLTKVVSKLKKDNNLVMVMGDFNTTQFMDDEQLKERFQNTLRKAKMEQLQNSLGCSSYWYGGEEDGIEIPSTLDHITLTNEFQKILNAHQAVPQAHCQKLSCNTASPEELGLSYQEVSDHCPLVAKGRI